MGNKLTWEKLLSETRLKPSSSQNNGKQKYGIRNDFESDYGRIIYSPAIRRMHDKTQVFPLSDDDNIHTRLTHSQEVMSIGYTFAIKLIGEIYDEKNKNIVEADFNFLKDKEENSDDNETIRAKLLRTLPMILQSVCLFHDIGNTPFGHFGEEIISSYFDELFKRNEEEGKKSLSINKLQELDFTEYDGNAQGLRVLTKLQILDNIFGLNLTSAILGTYIKYPNIKAKEKKGGVIGNKKHGVFFSEYNYFEKIMENCGLKDGDIYYRHPLCFLMEAADTIAYRTMDVEDGFNKGLYTVDYIIEKVKKDNKDIAFLAKLSEIETEKSNERTRMVRLRIFLIDYLVTESFKIFINNYSDIMNGKYQKELLDDDSLEIEKKLSDICTDKIYDSEEVNSLEVTGYSVITGLLDFYINAITNDKNSKNNGNGLEKKAYNLISKSIINSAIFEKAEEDGKDKIDITEFDFEDFTKLDDYRKLRIIVDYISGMTDKYALMHYQKISGQRI
ncbi:dGTP triphosphohydrolase [Chryseobacterium indologenes]|uniref:dGTP triphosphohydrolase n=1 Tax=Chryseobacterium indologenes TaxID=253 RepID=UPI001917A23D|nr:dNTP triphosphohydrolase [Chryseobacterium indologenes]QQQ70354.1 dNTP triphosphohydrolase [Chryseobacterium indologenes]